MRTARSTCFTTPRFLHAGDLCRGGRSGAQVRRRQRNQPRRRQRRGAFNKATSTASRPPNKLKFQKWKLGLLAQTAKSGSGWGPATATEFYPMDFQARLSINRPRRSFAAASEHTRSVTNKLNCTTHGSSSRQSRGCSSADQLQKGGRLALNWLFLLQPVWCRRSTLV